MHRPPLPKRPPLIALAAHEAFPDRPVAARRGSTQQPDRPSLPKRPRLIALAAHEASLDRPSLLKRPPLIGLAAHRPFQIGP